MVLLVTEQYSGDEVILFVEEKTWEENLAVKEHYCWGQLVAVVVVVVVAAVVEL